MGHPHAAVTERGLEHRLPLDLELVRAGPERRELPRVVPGSGMKGRLSVAVAVGSSGMMLSRRKRPTVFPSSRSTSSRRAVERS